MLERAKSFTATIPMTIGRGTSRFGIRMAALQSVMIQLLRSVPSMLFFSKQES
jgi:hypothetical protein